MVLLGHNENYRLYRSRYTASTAGKYLVLGGAEAKDFDDQEQFAGYVFKNGAATDYQRIFFLHASDADGSAPLGATGACILSLSANDYLEFKIYITGASNQTIDDDYTQFSVYRLA